MFSSSFWSREEGAAEAYIPCRTQGERGFKAGPEEAYIPLPDPSQRHFLSFFVCTDDLRDWGLANGCFHFLYTSGDRFAGEQN